MNMLALIGNFYKADRARKEKSTGLGLAIAKEMVERMGGKIEAKLVGDIFKIVIYWKLA